MCFPRQPPPPPPLPDPEPVAPKAEKTAEQVVTGNQRDIAKKGKKAATTTTRAAARKGTASLRIPLLTNAQTQSGNLRTPV
jgi:hypothetical protein|tara:strand:+ start:493 stop:735 length:243 start_codon:yes stop_codon:yes gene_type:complete